MLKDMRRDSVKWSLRKRDRVCANVPAAEAGGADQLYRRSKNLLHPAVGQ